MTVRELYKAAKEYDALDDEITLNERFFVVRSAGFYRKGIVALHPSLHTYIIPSELDKRNLKGKSHCV